MPGASMRYSVRSWRKAIRGRPRPRSLFSRRPILESLEERCLLSGGYRETDLVSDIAGMARTTDPHLLNPWGIGLSPTGPFWVADNGSGVATVYNGTGQPLPLGSALVVTIPPPRGRT